MDLIDIHLGLLDRPLSSLFLKCFCMLLNLISLKSLVRGGVWKLLSEEAARDALFKVLEKPRIARKQ